MPSKQWPQIRQEKGTFRCALKTLQTRSEVEITVSDNGPGFPSDFDIRRPALLASAKEDGLGVGLSFSRTIVESHGGELMIGGGVDGAVVSLRLRAAPGASS